MTEPVQDGIARPYLRTKKVDADRVGAMARRLGTRLGRQVTNPEVVSALVSFGEKHEDDIAALVAA